MMTRERAAIHEPLAGERAQWAQVSSGAWYKRTPAKNVTNAYAWGAWAEAPAPKVELKRIGRMAAVPVFKKALAPSPRN